MLSVGRGKGGAVSNRLTNRRQGEKGWKTGLIAVSHSFCPYPKHIDSAHTHTHTNNIPHLATPYFSLSLKIYRIEHKDKLDIYHFKPYGIV